MIKRYTRDAMNCLMTTQRKYDLWMQSLIAMMFVWVGQKKLNRRQFEMVRDNVHADEKRVNELDLGPNGFNHDAQAAIETGKESLLTVKGIGKKITSWLGRKVTSYDMEDPAFAKMIFDAGQLILKGIDALIAVIKKRAAEYRYTQCMFVTHNQPAVPGYLGLRFVRWIEMLERDKIRLNVALNKIKVGKFSGAGGTYDEISPEEEKGACDYLGLGVARGASQIIHRDYHAEVFSALVICARNMAQIANDLWMMTVYGRREAREYFSPTQRGSSAMPHKKNPITAERLRGMSTLMVGYLMAVMTQVMTYEERAIDQSCVERVVWPDGNNLVYYMLETLTNMVDKFTFFPKRMKKNMDDLQGIWASQYVKNALWEAGVTYLKFTYPNGKKKRLPVYKWCQECAFASWDQESNEPVQPLLQTLLEQGILTYLSRERLDKCFDVAYILRHADEVYDRVGIVKEVNDG